MAQLFTNNFSTTLANPCASTDTTIYLASGANLPVPGAPDWFYLTLTTPTTPETAWEIVKVTAVSGTTLTIVRGQDGTTAAGWAAGTRVELRPCGQSFRDMVGAGLALVLAAPPPIGSATPAPATFTTVIGAQFTGTSFNSITGLASAAAAALGTAAVGTSTLAARQDHVHTLPTAAQVGAPGTTGSGASGSWAISITGSAATLVAANSYTMAGLAVNGAITATGDVTAGYSDERLKENVQPLQYCLARVLSLVVVTYQANALAVSLGVQRRSDGLEEVGFLAQNVANLRPQAVAPAPFDRDEDGGSKSGEDYLTVRPEKLLPDLAGAIQELASIVQMHGQEIKALRLLVRGGR